MINALTRSPLPQMQLPSVKAAMIDPVVEQNILSAVAGLTPPGYSITPSNSLLANTMQASGPYAVEPTNALNSTQFSGQPYDMGQSVSQPPAPSTTEYPLGSPVSSGDTSSWLRMMNEGKVRNDPLSDRLVTALGSFAPDMGLTVEVFSGGQETADQVARGVGSRTGSTRHDHGHAADVMFYQNGRMLNWANPSDIPIFQEIVRRGRNAGLTGIGAGPGYMREGSMHIGFGAPAVWGDNGRSVNAPGWLREAYYGA